LKKENGENRNYVLDSSAFLALFEDEDGADTVQELLEKGVRGEIIVFASFVTFTEVFYITFRERGEEEAKKRIRLMHRLTITTVESSQELGLIAGRLKRQPTKSLSPTHGLPLQRFFMMQPSCIKTRNSSSWKMRSKP